MSVAKRRVGLQPIAPQGVHRVSTRAGSRRFTGSQIDSLPANGKKQDLTDPLAPGLILRIGPTGSKYWLFRYRWNGAATRIALGKYPTMSLALARTRAAEHRDQLSQGIDPRAGARAPGLKSTGLRKRPKVAKPRPIETLHPQPITRPSPPATRATPRIEPPSVGDKASVRYLAYEYVEHFVIPNRERPEEVIRILNKDVLPYWNNRDARTISHREVIDRLDEVVARDARVMANRTAKILKQMFNYGIHRAIIEKSPVQLLYSPGGREKPRDRALTTDEIIALVQGVDAVCASPQKAAIIMLLLLTLQRRATLALAEWKEIDLGAGVWKIPAEHDKMRRGHTLPLSGWAIEEFKVLKAFAGNSSFVMPTRDGKAAANPAIVSRSVTRLQNRFMAIGIGPFTTHDLRRTGRTQLAKLGISKEIAERILNHSTEQIEGTYNVYDYFVEKKSALERWEHHLRSLKDVSTGKPPAHDVMNELLRDQIERRSLVMLRRRLAIPAL